MLFAWPGGLPNYFQSLAEHHSYSICLDGVGGVVASGGIAYYAKRPHGSILSYGLVHPEYHGKGIGTALLLARLAVLDPGRQWYLVKMVAVEKSIGFYCRFGFKQFGLVARLIGHKTYFRGFADLR